ncbi:hypothetical protein INT43_005805 [Umbelopsis isabellina]|uniref:Uncharacterized protein n=1 Tax=Mortierella isabellina TaxID=91625 RepID=A0A8H7PIS4_MORIS|nr:hypothetical protein INT43_005805 [Umbelopsis isabellina]
MDQEHVPRVPESDASSQYTTAAREHVSSKFEKEQQITLSNGSTIHSTRDYEKKRVGGSTTTSEICIERLYLSNAEGLQILNGLPVPNKSLTVSHHMLTMLSNEVPANMPLFGDFHWLHQAAT